MYKYVKGDIVVIRDWDDMVEEYGYEDDDEDSINCRFSFTSEMKPLCGEMATVVRVSPSGGLDLDFHHRKPGIRYGWNYSTDMVRLYEEDVDYDTDEESLVNFVMG